MEDRKVLITGAYGFIGTNLVINWLMNHPDDRIILMDGNTYAARPKYMRDFIKECYLGHKIIDVNCDIRDRFSVSRFLLTYKPDLIIHLAAESHVCRSIKGPEDFITTNIVGTFNLLEEFRLLWNSDPEKKFIHVSTDEIFGELEKEDLPFNEKSLIKPRSPYAASKASSDLIALSYFETYGLPVIVTNCSNNFGPNQHDEKLIPGTIMRLLNGQKAKLYGSGEQIRDWLWVQDHCEALSLLADKGTAGERYCIGGEREMTNKEIVNMITIILSDMLQKDIDLDIEYTNDRPTDDKRYAIDCSKIKNLGWNPSRNFSNNIRSTIDFYVQEWNRAGLSSSVEGVNNGR